MSAEAAVAHAPGKKGKLMMIVMALFLLAGGAAGGWFYFKHSAAKSEEHAEEEAPKPKAPNVFLPAEMFTVNLADREHYMQVGVVYEVVTNHVGEAVKAQMPAIRSQVLMILSSKSPDDIATTEGKTKLAEEVLAAAKARLDEKTAKEIVTVHFSAFVIQ